MTWFASAIQILGAIGKTTALDRDDRLEPLTANSDVGRNPLTWFASAIHILGATGKTTALDRHDRLEPEARLGATVQNSCSNDVWTHFQEFST